MIDEMYLQQSAQYQSGECEGIDKERNLYKGIVAFIIVGFKLSIPFVVQTIPEVTTRKTVVIQLQKNNERWITHNISNILVKCL